MGDKKRPSDEDHSNPNTFLEDEMLYRTLLYYLFRILGWGASLTFLGWSSHPRHHTVWFLISFSILMAVAMSRWTNPMRPIIRGEGMAWTVWGGLFLGAWFLGWPAPMPAMLFWMDLFLVPFFEALRIIQRGWHPLPVSHHVEGQPCQSV